MNSYFVYIAKSDAELIVRIIRIIDKLAIENCNHDLERKIRKLSNRMLWKDFQGRFHRIW